MKKKTLAFLLSVAAVMSLAACGSSSGKGTEKEPENESQKEQEEETDKPDETPEQAPDLSGEWKQTNSNSGDTYQAIYISDDSMEVYWIMEDEDRAALYWAGTFKAPDTAEEPYSWDSQNDHDRTSSALLASGDDAKTFTYENGKLSYSVSAFGETTTVEASKQEWGYSEKIGSHSEEGGSVGPSIGSGDLGGYHVEVKGAALTEDHNGNSVIVVTYAWTNNSEDTKSAMVAMSEKAFQDGVQLETAVILGDDSYDSGAARKEVRPGTTIDVQCAYVLTSETSTVEFEITESFSFSDDMVTMEFDPATLM